LAPKHQEGQNSQGYSAEPYANDVKDQQTNTVPNVNSGAIEPLFQRHLEPLLRRHLETSQVLRRYLEPICEPTVDHTLEALPDTPLRAGIQEKPVTYSIAAFVQDIQTHLQQAWSLINEANDSLLKIGPNLEALEHMLTSFIPVNGDWPTAYNFHHLSEYIETLHHLNIKDAWVGVSQMWKRFTEKMRTLMSAADALKAKGLQHFPSPTVL
jgi:hypothetical protein